MEGVYEKGKMKTVKEYLEGSKEFNHVLKEARRYIKSPNEAPQGANVQKGPHGGYYYDTDSVTGGEQQEPAKTQEPGKRIGKHPESGVPLYKDQEGKIVDETGQEYDPDTGEVVGGGERDSEPENGERDSDIFQWVSESDIRETGLTEDFLKSFESEFGKIEDVYDGGAYERGKTIRTEDGEEYHVYDSEDKARLDAEDYVREMIQEEPESFSQDFLKNYYDISDADKNQIATEASESLREDLEYEGELSEDEIEQRIEEEYEYWYKGLDDPYQFLVEDMGIYTEEDLYKQPFMRIDDETAASDAVDVDGIGHFFATYDGDEVEHNGYVMYRAN